LNDFWRKAASLLIWQVVKLIFYVGASFALILFEVDKLLNKIVIFSKSLG
jgi:hypothetical protein